MLLLLLPSDAWPAEQTAARASVSIVLLMFMSLSGLCYSMLLSDGRECYGYVAFAEQFFQFSLTDIVYLAKACKAP